MTVKIQREKQIERAIYLVANALTVASVWLRFALYVWVAMIGLVPDRRIERTLVR